jgi:hypothetical protein
LRGTNFKEIAMLKEDQFPLLEKYAKQPELVVESFRAIIAGLEVGSIRNVVLNDAKDRISRAVYEAWRAHVNERFLNNGKWQALPTAAQDLSDSILIMGLHDMIATSKKLAKTKATGPMVDAMTEFVRETLPLAEAVKSLKDKVIKGRAPSAATSKPENPNKVVKTCPCCFRPIAVRGTMVHHGYERPGHGWQTASCPGIRFKPLEVSNEGLIWLIDDTRVRLASMESAYAKRSSLSSLTIQEGAKWVQITNESPKWKREFDYHVARLKSEIDMTRAWLPELENRLAEWKPETGQDA